jgi:arginine repressor
VVSLEDLMNVVMRGIAAGAAGLALSVSVSAQSKPTVDRVIQGSVQKIDAASKTVVVKTREGTEHVVAWTDKTVKHGVEDLKQGAHVVVHATDEAGKTIAHQTKVISAKTADWIEGTVVKVDRAAKTVTVRTVKGAVEVYDIAQDGIMHVGADVKATSKDIGESLKEGTRVVVHHTTEAGKKVAHAIDQKK